MKTRTTQLILPILALLAAMLACTTLTGKQEETPVATPGEAVQVEPGAPAAPAAPPAPAEPPAAAPPEPAPTQPQAQVAPGAQAGADVIDLSDPSWYVPQDWMTFYTFEGKYNFTGKNANGENVSGEISLEGIFDTVKDDFLLKMIPEGEGMNALATPITIASLDGTEYYESGSEFGCISMQNALTTTGLAELFDQEYMLNGTAQRIRPDETVKGQDVYVYNLTAENVDMDPITGSDTSEFIEGRLYLDKQKGYVVGFWFKARATVDIFSDEPIENADIYYELYFKDINEPKPIELPAGCVAQGEEEYPFPVLEGATDVTSMGGAGVAMVNFTVKMTMEEATKAYQAAMEAAGYSLSNTMSLGTITNHEYTGPAGTVIVNFSQAPNDKGITITVLQQ